MKYVRPGLALKTISPYHGAGILFWTTGRQDQLYILLGKRIHNPQRGKWSIPAGGWDEEDSYDKKGRPDYLKTAIRESCEEIRITVGNLENLDYLWRRHLPFFHFVVYAYQLSEKVDVVRYQEFSEVKWFSVDALPADCVGFVRSQVSALVRKYHKGEKWYGKNIFT